ncbi:MAG: helix-turn-helix transcriptional regulator [Anaerolineales bacterium]|jgi:DNA-binding PadR family transcriptional regulator
MKADDYLPLTETSFFILLSLATTPKHGYGIIKEVETLSAGRVVLAAGTLYSALRRMLEDGWIERLEDNNSNNDSRERKLYRLTDLGRRIFELETKRLQRLIRLTTNLKAGS